MNLGAHSFDIIQYLTGSCVKTVSAKVGGFADGMEIEGNGQIFAILENGITASITLSGYESVPWNETELIFTKGMIKTSAQNGNNIFVSKDRSYEEIKVDRGNPLRL